MKKNTRIYKFKDIDMLMAAAVIVEQSIIHVAILNAKRSAWTLEFFHNLKQEIDGVIQTELGKDKAGELRAATLKLNAMQEDIIKNLSLLNVQIQQDFRTLPERRDEILLNLGFTNFYSKSSFKDQDAMIKYLFRFKTNLTPQLRTEIVSKGIENELLEAILMYPERFKDAEVHQELLKGERKAKTADALELYNDIYIRVINIVKIAQSILKDQPTIRKQFSFTNTVNNLHANTQNPSQIESN